MFITRLFNNGAWSEGRYNSFVTSTLRAGSRRWPPKYECLNEARTERKININTGRMAQHYLCAICLNEFPAKEINIDHIVPIGVNKSWDEFVNGLYCEKDNLQAICISCHKKKSKEERPPKGQPKK